MNQKGFIAFIILIVLAGISIFIYFKGQNTLPSDRLYFVKNFKEQIYLTTNSLNYESLINANIVLANERVNEIVKLIENQAKEELVVATLLKLENNQRSALDYSLRIKKRGSYIADYINKLEEALMNHRKILSNLYYFAPKSLYNDLDRAVEVSGKLLDLTRESRYN